MGKIKLVTKLAPLSSNLLIVGGLNWGLSEWLNFDIVQSISNVTAPIIGTVLYSVIGISAVLVLLRKFKVA